jgi:hypothetical protein
MIFATAGIIKIPPSRKPLNQEKIMESFETRALEIHSSRIWQQRQADNALEFMLRYHLNTLVIHTSDLIDMCVAPESHFPNTMMWKRWPVRYHRMMNNRYYLNNIIRIAKEREIRVYVSVKELSFDEWLLSLYPQLRKPDGSLCATDPFWFDFLEKKTSEFLDNIPDVAGIIVSPGTRESKVSIAVNRCTCPRCQAITQTEWYKELISAMYRPIKKRGKTLGVRDFTRFSKEQDVLVTAINALSPDIIIAMKNTPHDFYPTFPHNPKIGTLGKRPQWIEYDAWGQFGGAGFFPCCLVEDLQYRLKHGYKNGVCGVQLRCDWENMTETGTFNSLNQLNIIAGAMLSENIDTDLENIYQEWAYNYGLLSPLVPSSFDQKPAPIAAGADYKKVRDFMKSSWNVTVKGVWIRGHIFGEDCLFPDTMNRGMSMMFFNHNMEDWVPGASAAITATDENIAYIFEEKAQARKEAAGLAAVLDADTLGLPPELAEDLKDMIDLYQVYIEGFYFCTRACYLAQKALEQGGENNLYAARDAVKELAAYAEIVHRRVHKRDYHHHEVFWLLDHKRLLSLASDIDGRLDRGEKYEYFKVTKNLADNHNL